eukprot:3936714-Rhodomonas_salina.3
MLQAAGALCYFIFSEVLPQLGWTEKPWPGVHCRKQGVEEHSSCVLLPSLPLCPNPPRPPYTCLQVLELAQEHVPPR